MVGGPETTIIDDVTGCEVASDVGKDAGNAMTPIEGRVVDCGEGSSRAGGLTYPIGAGGR